MNTRLFLLIALLGVTIQAFAQTDERDSTAKATELLKIEQSLEDGVAKGDTALWGKYLAPGYFIINEDGASDNRKTFLAALKPLPKGSSGHINVTKPHFSFVGNVAVLNYVADEYENYQGNQLHTTYGTMEVYSYENNAWHLNNSQVFEIPQLPPSINLNDSILQQYMGTYYLTNDISCVIALQNHQLTLQKKGREPEQLFAETTNIFFRKADARGRKFFIKAASGNWQMLERRNGQDVVWVKK